MTFEKGNVRDVRKWDVILLICGRLDLLQGHSRKGDGVIVESVIEGTHCYRRRSVQESEGVSETLCEVRPRRK